MMLHNLLSRVCHMLKFNLNILKKLALNYKPNLLISFWKIIYKVIFVCPHKKTFEEKIV